MGNIQNKNSYVFFHSDKNLDAFKSGGEKISYDFKMRWFLTKRLEQSKLISRKIAWGKTKLTDFSISFILKQFVEGQFDCLVL